MARDERTAALTFVTALLCGLAALVWVSAGEGERDVTIIGPDHATNPPPDAAPPAAIPPPVPGDTRPPAGVPIGSVVAWLKSCTNTPALPREWVECNGQTLDLPGSPYHRQPIPNLNGAGDQERRFLRGASASGATGGAESHIHPPILMDRAAPRVVNVSARKPASNLPPYYEVVWIVRVL